MVLARKHCALTFLSERISRVPGKYIVANQWSSWGRWLAAITVINVYLSSTVKTLLKYVCFVRDLEQRILPETEITYFLKAIQTKQ